MIHDTLLDRWLRGTTCDRTERKSILFENPQFIVFKHHSHSEYLGRFSGSDCCRVYAVLYDKRDIPSKGGFHNFTCAVQPLLKWEGRINTKRILDDCAGLGIRFP